MWRATASTAILQIHARFRDPPSLLLPSQEGLRKNRMNKCMRKTHLTEDTHAEELNVQRPVVNWSGQVQVTAATKSLGLTIC